MNRFGDNLVHFGPNEELVRALKSFGVEFVLIGGLAISWYCSDRQVDDMDLLVNPSMENSEKISDALSSLNIRGFERTSFAKLGLQIPLKQNFYAELLTPLKDAQPYTEVVAEAIDAKLFNIPIKLASVASLLKMKLQTVATLEQEVAKHKEDIARLQEKVV